MSVTNHSQQMKTHHADKQKAQAQALRKPKQSTGGTIGGSVGGAA